MGQLHWFITMDGLDHAGIDPAFERELAIIQTVDQVLAMMPQLRANIPNTIDLSVVVDRSLTIRASIIEVEHSLLIAIGLVILVVLVFLRNLRSTLIPVIVVLVSLIGAGAVMYFYRFY